MDNKLELYLQELKNIKHELYKIIDEKDIYRKDIVYKPTDYGEKVLEEFKKKELALLSKYKILFIFNNSDAWNINTMGVYIFDTLENNVYLVEKKHNINNVIKKFTITKDSIDKIKNIISNPKIYDLKNLDSNMLDGTNQNYAINDYINQVEYRCHNIWNLKNNEEINEDAKILLTIHDEIKSILLEYKEFDYRYMDFKI